MKVVLITRSTLYTGRGGDTVQVIKTAHYLCQIGIEVDIKLSNEVIDYGAYDLLHFFNITRPADLLRHSKISGKPYVISTILLDQSEYDRHYRRGIGRILRFFSADTVEYIKTMARCLLGKDHLASWAFIWKGQRASIMQLLRGASMLLPNSPSEYERLLARYGETANHIVIPNGVDLDTFNDPGAKKDPDLVLCVARIEGNKNQVNLIKALNNTRFKVVLVGKPAPNQMKYYANCRAIAANNIEFIDYLPLPDLVNYYKKAKVHILPSWFETTGLSTLEAAAMGCNIVITDKGDTRCYFEDYAFYCDPLSPESILQAAEKASIASYNPDLYNKIVNNYTWQKTAAETLDAYRAALAPRTQNNLIPNHESVVFN
ncbi:MAG: glycosyltransferase family 4 protein [Bacteroidota bacterium]